MIRPLLPTTASNKILAKNGKSSNEGPATKNLVHVSPSDRGSRIGDRRENVATHISLSRYKFLLGFKSCGVDDELIHLRSKLYHFSYNVFTHCIHLGM
jgi:hypothetical protein